MTTWQKIETAPKDGTPLLLACTNWHGEVPIKVGGWNDWSKDWHIFGASWEPTHWMPLPDPPTAD